VPVEEAPATVPSDGLEGEVVEVPTEVPPPVVDPAPPVDGESTVGQTITPPPAPVVPTPPTQTEDPAPSAPVASDQGEVAP
jgi:hypothetical protein